MKRYILVFVLMFAGAANATVVDFESGLDPLFTYSSDVMTGPTNLAGTGYHTLRAFTGSSNVAFNGSAASPSTFTWAGVGSTFDLNSFVIAGAWGSQTLTIEGLLNGASIFSSSLAVTTDAVSVFSPSWSGIDAFRIAIGTDYIADPNLIGSGGGQHWALDNITVSAVPVPAAAWLFGSALLGFFGFSRKKANA